MISCPCCDSKAEFIFDKKGFEYFQCVNCETIFVPNGLPNDNMVGGGFEIERNEQQNQERIFRFSVLTKNGDTILDFGSGHNMLVKDGIKDGLIMTGYDKYNPEINILPTTKFDLVSMVECIEHLSAPFEELDIIWGLLKENGILYLETSFTDVAKEENIPLEVFEYVNASVGHSTIFSHKGMDILMAKKGFEPMYHINRHVRLYKKITK